MSLFIEPMKVSRPPIRHGKLWIDVADRRTTFDNHILPLSPTEFVLLANLAQAAPQTLAFGELAQQIGEETGESGQDANEMLRYHIYLLRRKLKEVAGDEALIETVQAVGYRLSSPEETIQPNGSITFLFSDIEGSTQLWEQNSQSMKRALRRHDTLLRQATATCNGYVFKTMGDGFYIAFSRAVDALAAALAAQRALHAEEWPESTRLRVRMALATGPAESRDDDYFGPPLNLAARLLSAGHGGQILLDQITQAEITGELPPGVKVRDMGLRRLRGLREHQRIFQAVVDDLPAHFPPLRTLDPRPTNLPAELTPFVGRENEVKAVSGLLRRPQSRLVTLTGPGGIGKSRLSLQVAASLQDEYEDGIFFVPLASIHDPALIPSAIARAVGAPESSDNPSLEPLIAHLRSRQLLLVLDNFEQLVDGSPLVNELLRGAPSLKILVTSREALLIYGEQIYPVTPLTLPDLRQPITLDLLARFSATALFVQRVGASAPGLTLGQADAPIVAEICTRLDGLPLVIELAAARANQFSLPEIAAQLTRRLGFLTSGLRDLPDRQRTLRGALDWSYDLLNGDEQGLFARLAVFVGGWTEGAAQELAGGMSLSPAEVTATLHSLTAKSLLQYQPEETPRFRMLESIREYAWEHLARRDELAATRQLHAAWYRNFVLGFESSLMGDEQAEIYKAMKSEEDNIRAALDWSLEVEGDKTAIEMCSILWRWWAAHSYLREGRSWLDRALARQSAAPPAVRALALWGAGRLAFFQADYNAAEAMLQQSLALYRQIGDDEGSGWILDAIGAIALQRKNFGQARQLFEESLALHRAEGSQRGISHTLDDLGQLAFRLGDIAQATLLFEEALHLRRQSGSPEGMAVAIVNLSEALGLQGEYERAETLLLEGLELYRQLGQSYDVLLCLGNLGHLKKQMGDSQAALDCYTQSLGILREVEEEEEPELVAESLIGLAGALYPVGKVYAAAQILGAVEKRLNNLGANPTLREEYQRHCEAVGDQLSQAVWNSALDEGSRMSLEEITEVILPQTAVS